MITEVDDSDFSDNDETDKLLEEYLNDNECETEHPTRNSQEMKYTAEQREDIQLYKTAINLNRETEAKYKQVEESLTAMLAEIRKELKENEAALLNQSTTFDGGFNYLRCGKPYFKDKNNFVPPDNEDTIVMRRAQMYDFSLVSSVPGWTVKDKTEFVSALLEMSRDIRRKELRSKIAILRQEKNNEEQIARLEIEICELINKTLTDIALPLDQDYDWEHLANSLNRRHTAQEYQALWKLFFHPSINKTIWTKAEHQHLKRIVDAHNMQDWDNIAKELNTGRTGYQCFVYYRTNFIEVSANRMWTMEEVEYLQRAVEYFRQGPHIPWGKVASAMENRTKIQVYNKFTRMMERRKGRFLEEEDTVLLKCYERFGDDYKKIAEYIPGRSAVQIKTRFNILTKMRLSTTWSEQDDRKLVQIMANRDASSNFSMATQHFPGKDRVNIRSRYVTLSKWMKAHPTLDVSMAPRRGARRLLHGHSSVNLKDAIANLNKRIESELNTKKKRKLTPNSNVYEIESCIMACLTNEAIKEETSKRYDLSEPGEQGDPIPRNGSLENIDNLRNLLIFLNSSLDKDKFNNSIYASKYPGFIETTPRESHVKVKSYSRKANIRTIKIEGIPDIWGNNTAGLKRTSYVLPPNYYTITGCRMFTKSSLWCSNSDEEPEEEINLSLMQRRNPVFKRAIDSLKERFTPLFMWPVILSNEMPDVTEKPVKYVSRPPVEKKASPPTDGLIMPTARQRYLNYRGNQSRRSSSDHNDLDIPKEFKKHLRDIQYSTEMVFNPGCSNVVISSEEDSVGST